MKSDAIPTQYTPAVLREIERTLSEPLFLGIPIGQTLNDSLVVGLYNRRIPFNRQQQWMAYAKICYYTLRIHCPHKDVALPPVRPVLVTCLSGSIRLQELVLPVVEAIGKDRCIVACVGPALSSTIQGIKDVDWKQAMPRVAQIWQKNI